MSAFYYSPAGRGSGGVRFRKRKSRFTFDEVQLLLNEVKNNRHIVIGKFNRGVSSDVKKRTWAEITARINEISECPREIIEIIKKWSDLKCDTKRKVAAMRAGGGGSRGGGISRIARDLSPVENMVHQILQLPPPADAVYPTSWVGAGTEENGDGEEEDEDEDVMLGVRPSSSSVGDSSNGRLDAPAMAPPPLHSLGLPMSLPMPLSIPISMPTPLPPHSLPQKRDVAIPGTMYSVSSRDAPQQVYDLQYEIPSTEEPVVELEDSDEERPDGPRSSNFLAPPLPAGDEQFLSGLHRSAAAVSTMASSSSSAATAISSSATAAPSSPSALPQALPSSSTMSARDRLAQNASLSVQEQRATNLLMESVSRSLEMLSESVQQLVEAQQEFVRDSLRLQRETVHILRDFSTGALALMRDKLNGRPTP